MNSFKRNPLHTLFLLAGCLLANLAGKASKIKQKQTHELVWNFNPFRSGELTWENKIHYGDSIRILCPTKSDRIGLGLKSFTLYFIKNPQSPDDCRYQANNWDLGYTCDLGASDDDPNVFTFSVKKAYLPGTRTFLEGERYTLVAIEDYDINYSPKHTTGQLSNLCKDYSMKLNFLVNQWQDRGVIGEDDENYGSNGNDGENEGSDGENVGIELPITQISPLPDNGFKERPFDESNVEVEDFEDVSKIFPVLLGIILVMVVVGLSIFCFSFNKRSKKRNKDTNQNTIESSYAIREGKTGINGNTGNTRNSSINWPENNIKTQVPHRISPNFQNFNTSIPQQHPHTFQHLQNMNIDGTLGNPTMRNQIGTIVGGNLENTTLSTSLKYRRASPTNPMFQNNQFYRTAADPYPDSLSKPLLRPVTSLEINNSQTIVNPTMRVPVMPNMGNLPSPNDTGCETGASHDGSDGATGLGATVLI